MNLLRHDFLRKSLSRNWSFFYSEGPFMWSCQLSQVVLTELTASISKQRQFRALSVLYH